MKIDTKFLGQVDVTDDAVIQFPEGIPGFLDEKRFALIPLNETSPFLILQSIKTKSVGFMVATPYAFKADYVFDLPPEDVAQLKIERPEDVVVYGILTLKDTLAKSTINLLAPVVMNEKTKLAKQIVLPTENDAILRYPLKAAEGSAQ